MGEERPRVTLGGLFTAAACAGLFILVMIWVVGLARHGEPPSATVWTVKNLEVALRQYDFDFGEYPPDAAMDPRFDLPSECLVYYLGTAFRKEPGKTGTVLASKNGGPYFEWKREFLKDTDGDGLKEFVDYWGRPYMYDNLRDDPNGFTDCSHPKFGPDPRGGKGRNSRSYDLWSQGPPGKNSPIAPIVDFKP